VDAKLNILNDLHLTNMNLQVHLNFQQF